MNARDELLDEYGRADAAPLGTLAELRTKLDAAIAEALTAAADDLHDMWRQTENAQQAGGIALAMHRIRDLSMAAVSGSTAGGEQAEDPIPSALAAKADLFDHLERITLPNPRREIEWHQAGKKRWRDRAEKAEAKVATVLDICDREQRNAMRWQEPIPVPEWVTVVQRAALGDSEKGAQS